MRSSMLDVRVPVSSIHSSTSPVLQKDAVLVDFASSLHVRIGSVVMLENPQYCRRYIVHGIAASSIIYITVLEYGLCEYGLCSAYV